MRIRPVLGAAPEALNRDGRDPFLARLGMVLFHPLRAARQRINAWVAARVTRQPGPVAIPRHRIYIVPTRYGYGYGLLLVVMLLGAMNYSNSMAFALTFLLAGLGLLGMHHTHANLLQLRLRVGRVAPVFAGEEALELAGVSLGVVALVELLSGTLATGSAVPAEPEPTRVSRTGRASSSSRAARGTRTTAA